MGEIKWTKAQKEAIEASGSNILVSAAAGSGKTAVLVERVIQMITRKEDPVDIDSLVVMTFTKAAAAQMKSKIYQEIRKELTRRPYDARLRQQMMKVQNAKICTIDSLCSQIVRDHFQNIDLDPGFRIADDAQIRQMEQDVLSAIIEEHYQEGTGDFLHLAQYYTERNDKKLEQIVLTLYRYARSHPEPEAWLKGMVSPYQMAAEGYSGENTLTFPEGMENWMPVFADCAASQLEQVQDMARAGLRICEMNYGPLVYAPLFTELLELAQKLEGESFDNKRYLIMDCLNHWKAAPRVKSSDTDIDQELKKTAQEYRKDIKTKLEDILDRFLYDDLEEVFRQMGAVLPVARAICELTLQFGRELDRVKHEKKLADFSDIAHDALKILIRYQENGEIARDAAGHPVYTEVADQMARQIREVIVDEYQDTNMLQEYLVMALSAQRFGRPDVFMVGDVKQSIYRFRMACPDLFNEKMERFRQGQGRLIILDHNFRSRKEVLDLTNTVFEQTMIREAGGINYKMGHALTYGGTFGPFRGPEQSFIPEILMIKGSAEQARYQEAYQIASRIETLVSEGRYHFSDIVILTRASDNPQLEKVLYQRGIPMVKNTGKGFFETFEIRLVLDLLKIIDNPLQDIPLAAVLHSPLCSASADDLARIRLAGNKQDSLYACLCNYEQAKTGEADRTADMPETEDRFIWLRNKLALWQEKAAFMGMRDFLAYVLKDSGLELILTAMPQGEDRRVNLEFFKSLIRDDFRDGSTGLFPFLQYIRELMDNDVDYGTLTASGDTRAVRLMTIHRSKGLEFPVVFLALCGKEYNESDIRGDIIPDRTLGLGIEFRDTKEKMIKKTILMQTIREKQKKETRAEEMRLLYVAMTRAKEKLIITGSMRYLDSHIKTWERSILSGNSGLKPWEILQASSYLDLLGLSLHPRKDTDEGFRLDYAEPEEMQEQRSAELLENQICRQEILALASLETDTRQVRECFEYRYPYENATQIRGKLTASSLKNKPDKDPRGLPESSGMSRRIPVWRTADSVETEEEQELLVGAERGSAYHKFLELFDYQGQAVEEQLRQMEDTGRLDHIACCSIDPDKIRTFLASSLGKRMAQAAVNEKLFREKQFVIGYTQNVNDSHTMTGPGLRSDVPDEELLLVQGIIDAWFLEEDKVVLVDYKTDKETDEQYYRNTYAPQLRTYADVLERCTGLLVGEKIVYSLELGREILLD